VIDGLIRAGAPIDGFGVGSALTTSSDKPALDIAYKLVEYAGRGCAKYSAGKATLPGAKQVFRTGPPARDVLERRGADAAGEPLLRLAWHDGRRPVISTIEDARARARAQVRTLPTDWRLPPGPDTPPLPTVGPDLASYAHAVRHRLMATEVVS
jgi:nicotinate phosphoribosyltransferase